MREKVRVNGPIWVSWLLALVVLAAWYSPGRVADPLTLACLFAAQFYLSTHSTDIGGSIQHTYETLLSLAAAAVYG
ncbi:MAG TPA: hypothetical protein VD902_13075, partial [Symbiobacteriaceae bacterium]|nr:hypothetical protein [Symbiobacteriaceae bacterium]